MVKTLFFSFAIILASSSAKVPLVINTWKFTGATQEAWNQLTNGGSRLDALEKGINVCEDVACGGSVGFGGHPDSTGEVTLDSLIMDGPTHDVGAVGYLRRIKSAISVARAVLEHTTHSLLVGDAATSFAKMMGFKEESLETPQSDKDYQTWASNACQPNYYINFVNVTTACAPYSQPTSPLIEEKEGPLSSSSSLLRMKMTTTDKEGKRVRRSSRYSKDVHDENHDTIGMVVVDINGDMACGTSTNGLGHKIAGRVGDSPLPGAGCYVDNDVGGAAATGDGDTMLRFSPTAMAVEYMRHGASPQKACEQAILKIASKYPSFTGGMICANTAGEYGAAGWNWTLQISVRDPTMEDIETYDIPAFNPPLSSSAAADIASPAAVAVVKA